MVLNLESLSRISQTFRKIFKIRIENIRMSRTGSRNYVKFLSENWLPSGKGDRLSSIVPLNKKLIELQGTDDQE